jgi:AraC-like DNA-binding protein
MQPTTSEHGILHPRETSRRIDLLRYLPKPEVGRFVERYWAVHWDLAEPYDVHVIPHPCGNISFMPGVGGQVHGVGTSLSTQPLQGAGMVFGVKFRPGGFTGFTGAPAASLVDVSEPLDAYFGRAAADLTEAVLSAETDQQRIAAVDEFICQHQPGEFDDQFDLVLEAVSTMLNDRSVTRVDDVASRLEVSVRTLQRLFRRYVGVSPKWVIRRYRMHDGAERLAAGADPSTVATELGWFDQAHFTRDFTSLIGMPPATYLQMNAQSEAVLV